MRLVVDLDKCLGYANCVADAPDIFEIRGDDMVVTILDEHPGEDRREAVELAVADCPARALRIEEDIEA